MKRLLLSILTLVLSLSTWAGLKMVKVDGILYFCNAEDKTAKIAGGNTVEAENVVIPSKVTDDDDVEYTVTIVSESAFSNCYAVKSFTLPDGITEIQDYAFLNCSNLKSINMPASLQSIGISAFAACLDLTEVAMPATLTSIAVNAFEGCGSLTSISVADGNTTFDSRNNCNAIIKTSSNSVVLGCVNTVIPTGVEAIDTLAFRLPSQSVITIPASVTKIAGNAITSAANGSVLTVYNYAQTPQQPSGSVKFFDQMSYTKSTLYVPYGRKSAYESAEVWKNFGTITEMSPLTYSYDATSKTATVTGVIAGSTDTELMIPASVAYDGADYAVTTIGQNAFKNNTALTSVELPNTLVTIGEGAFSGCEKLGNVTFPESLCTIREDAFAGCNSITAVSIPKNVDTFEPGAFKGCTGITSISVDSENPTYECPEESNAVIYTYNDGKGIVLGCKNTAVPRTVNAIGSYAFSGNDFSSFEISARISLIGEKAFASCTQLTNIFNYASTPQTLGSDAFDATTLSTATLYVPYGKKSAYKAAAGWNGFKNIEEMSSLVCSYNATEKTATLNGVTTSLPSEYCIPSSVTEGGVEYTITAIGANALKNQPFVTIYIPKAITTIEENAFVGCTNITTIVNYAETPQTVAANAFPSEVIAAATLKVPYGKSSVYAAADVWKSFSNVSELSDLKFTYRNTDFTASVESRTWAKSADEIIIPEKVGHDGKIYTVTEIEETGFYCSPLKRVTLPNTLKKISRAAFCNTDNLESIVIPESVTVIEKNAFNGSGISHANLPQNITEVAEGVFENCTNLTVDFLHEGITKLGDEAFCFCTMEDMLIPSTLTEIGDDALTCYGMKTIKVAEGNPVYDSRNNCNALIETATDKVILGCKNSTIPEGIKIIGEGAFYYCDELEDLNFPESLQEIQEIAFACCTKLKSAVIPAGTTTIGYGTFEYCESLTSIDIPSTVTVIEENAFEGCTGLKSITLPAGLKTIEDGALGDCGFTEITIPASVEEIGKGILAGCSSLERIVVENGNTKFDSRDNCNAIINTANNSLIAASNNTFIPEGVTSLGNIAFYGLKLKSITIPASVTYIGSYALGDLKNLRAIYNYATEAQRVYEDTFGEEYDLKEVTVYVPQASINSYKNNNWGLLGSIQPLSSVTVTLNSAGFATYSSAKNTEVMTEGVKAYFATQSGSDITLVEANGTIPASTGVILYGAPNAEVKLAQTTEDIATNNVDNVLLPTTTATQDIVSVPAGSSVWVLGDEKNMVLFTETSFSANRAYIVYEMPDGAKPLTLSFDASTSISSLNSANDMRDGKFIEDGQMIILKNGVKYNANGQRMK